MPRDDRNGSRSQDQTDRWSPWRPLGAGGRTWLRLGPRARPQRAPRAAPGDAAAPAHPGHDRRGGVPKLEWALPVNPTDRDRHHQRRGHHPPAARRRVRGPQGRGDPRDPDRPQAHRAGAQGARSWRSRPPRSTRRSTTSRCSVAGIGREAWLRTLDKERGISPIQYARDIIYPALALRKLAAPRVQVTDKDMKDSFEAQYGDKLRCRIIMVDKLHDRPGDLGGAAEEPRRLREAGAGASRSTRAAGRSAACSPSRSPATPTRGPSPTPPSPARRRRPQRQGPQPQAQGRRLHRPDPGGRGDLGHPEARGGRSRPGASNPKDQKVSKPPHEMIYEVKLKEAMGEVFVEDLMKAAAIDNKLTGHINRSPRRGAGGRIRPDIDVKLMSNPNKPADPAEQTKAAAVGTPPGRSSPAARRLVRGPASGSSHEVGTPATSEPRHRRQSRRSAPRENLPRVRPHARLSDHPDGSPRPELRESSGQSSSMTAGPSRWPPSVSTAAAAPP